MKTKNSAAPGELRRDVRPPIAPDSAPSPGAADRSLRRTVWVRPVVAPQVWNSTDDGFPASSRYVRTFWTAVLGPGAVADLLRLATAASRGRSLRRPPSLSRLSAAGLAREVGGRLEIRVVIPPLTPRQLRSLHPAIRRLHDEPGWARQTRSAA